MKSTKMRKLQHKNNYYILGIMWLNAVLHIVLQYSAILQSAFGNKTSYGNMGLTAKKRIYNHINCKKL